MTTATSSPSSAGRLARLAGWSERHRWRALGLWVLIVAALGVASATAGSRYHDDFSLPGTESQAATDLLRAHAPARAGDTIEIVVADRGGVRAPAVGRRVRKMLARVDRQPHVASVSDPYASAGRSVSRDGTVAFATVTLDGTGDAVPASAVRRIERVAGAARGDGLRVELGGNPVKYAEPQGGQAAEGAGTLAALVILALVFGSALAACLPIVTALLATGSTFGLIALASHLVTVPSYAPPLMALVGLGVGIDYALLVFSRYRAELLAGAGRTLATATALQTAGRSVLFAGGTVIVALLGLLALGLGSLQGLALSMALVVATTMLASLTLLPALLALLGPRLARRIEWRADVRRRRRRPPAGAGWRRWTARVQRRPVVALVAGVAVLLALSAPALGMRLGFADAGNEPASTTDHRAYELLARGFGPGANGPLTVVVAGGAPGTPDAVRAALSRTPGVVGTAVDGPPTAGLSTVLAFPSSAPQAQATASLVRDVRRRVLAPIARRTGARVLVGGPTAAADDYAAALAGRLALFVAIVVGLSALLLAVMFRSLLIPIKAAALNLLSIGASLGVVTLVFGHGLFGVAPGPIEAYVPVMVFAIAFGLSMDYEVFLVARIQEAWRRTGDPRRAVADGLAGTGGVITAAAAIMVVVFGASMLSPDRMQRQFGLGLAVAILLDALLVRCLVVPAAMTLLGRRAWWLPRALAPRLGRPM